jgi:hypothetical protein
LGQPTNDNLKELYKNQRKQVPVCIGVLASNPNCTATNGLWKQVVALVTKNIFKQLYMRLDAETPEIHL